jgi:PAS domain S-box-containing protein
MRSILAGVVASLFMRPLEQLAVIAAIADELPCGVCVATAPDGRFVYSNRAFEEIMGMGPVADVGVGEYSQPYGIYTRDGQVYPEDRLPFVRALQTPETVVVDDIVIHRRDGRRVYVRAFGKPMFDGSGAITHVAIAFFDITREAEAQREREQAQAKLAQAERLASIGMLAAGVAHEVNNPLSYVVGSLELALRRLSGADRAPALRLTEIDEKLRDALQGAERVRTVVRDLKVFSRVQDARPSAVDLRSAVQAALHMAHNEIRHRARVVRDLLAVPAVWAEEGRVGQVLLNLVVNAAQAIPEGDAERNEIRVATRTTDEGWAQLEISDSGAGIAPDQLPKIFDPFFTTKPEGVGTGLGLSICHAIVTDLGGRIEVASTPGKGTTFRVLLPPAGRAVESRAPDQAEGVTASRRASVLVIDDEPLILKMVAQMLSVEHEVTCEPTAKAALERIRGGQRFDAILCDLMMPQVTGMDLYESLLEIAPKQAQSMLFLTGGAFTARAQAFLDKVPNATIEKPFDSATLVTRVRKLLA